MKTDFTTAPLASGLRGADGGTVEKSHRAPNTKKLTPPMLEWAATRRITLIHTQPGNPQQNAYVERYNRTVRYDWLTQNLLGSLDEVQLGATAWLWAYNNERPNMALGGITPRQKLASKYLTDSTAAYC